jgi:hypothetical protein
MSGYVHAHRRALHHPAFRNQSEALSFVWLTMLASWRQTKVRYKGRIIVLERGQLAMSIRDMAVALDRQKGWVERFLTRLKTETMIETCSETGLLVITICNYDVYQPIQDSGRTLNGTEKRTVPGQEQDTEQGREKGKKEEKKKEPPIGGTREIALPADFEPALTDAAQKIIDGWPSDMFDRELAQFKDDATAKGKRFKDWQAALRTWIRNADKWRRQNGEYRNGANSIARRESGWTTVLRSVSGGDATVDG